MKNAPPVGTGNVPVGAPNVPVGVPSESVGAAKVLLDVAKLPVDAPTSAAIVGSSISSSRCLIGCRAESTSAPTAIASPGCAAVSNEDLA